MIFPRCHQEVISNRWQVWIASSQRGCVCSAAAALLTASIAHEYSKQPLIEVARDRADQVRAGKIVFFQVFKRAAATQCNRSNVVRSHHSDSGHLLRKRYVHFGFSSWVLKAKLQWALLIISLLRFIDRATQGRTKNAGNMDADRR